MNEWPNDEVELDATKTFYKRMRRISWREHVSNGEVLKKMVTSRTLFKIRKRQLKFLGCITRKVGVESLRLTGHIERKSNRGKQCVT